MLRPKRTLVLYYTRGQTTVPSITSGAVRDAASPKRGNPIPGEDGRARFSFAAAFGDAAHASPPTVRSCSTEPRRNYSVSATARGGAVAALWPKWHARLSDETPNKIDLLFATTTAGSD